MTQPKSYKRKAPDNIYKAMQWTLENKDAVFAWLNEMGINYSFHDISSGGNLIIYSDGTRQINLYNYIMFNDQNVLTVYSPILFKKCFVEA